MVENNKIQTSFAEEEAALFMARVRIAAFYMAVPLVMSFSFVDYFFMPEQWWPFFYSRLLSIPVCITAYALYQVRWVREKFVELPAIVVSLYLGSYVAFLVSRSGYEDSSYYAGLNLIAIGSLSFIPWKLRPLIFSVIANYVPYFAIVLIGRDTPPNLSALVPHFSFCISTIFMGALTCYLSRNIRMKEYDSRLKLHEEIVNKSHIIEEKTKEGIYLEKLMNQFSPQITSAVKSGKLSVEGLARREITCLFIDVENSTSRSVRLDRDAYTKVLSEFFALVTEILIRHDITVGTYLGDGLLAFANAPQEQEDHRKKLLNSALDILRMHSSRQKYYLEKWRTNFNIRMGINTGFAYVGFFPSFKRGTYTALGEPVNLASRLCSTAPDNSILATKVFIKETSSDLKDVRVTSKGILDSIKGFEGESFELFSISPKPLENADQSSSCPLCASSLLVENSLGDCNLVRCVSCGYSDLVPIEKDKMAA